MSEGSDVACASENIVRVRDALEEDVTKLFKGNRFSGYPVLIVAQTANPYICLLLIQLFRLAIVHKRVDNVANLVAPAVAEHELC